MDTEIERIYLSHKIPKCYPDRYDNAVFEKFNEMNSDTQFQNDYKKWKAGINYKTNRKIKIWGKTYKELEKSRFSIKVPLKWCPCVWTYISFDELKNIDAVKYLEETEKIKHEIDIENAGIIDYNKKFDIVFEKIKNLESWDDFVEFVRLVTQLLRVVEEEPVQHPGFGYERLVARRRGALDAFLWLLRVRERNMV